jgi:hypothetical protein
MLRTALFRLSALFLGIGAEFPATIRRRPVLDADDAEKRSVSSDMFDNYPVR